MSKTRFTVDVSGGAHDPRIKLAGPIDEHADFPKLDASQFHSLLIDVSGVTMINSLGIRSWVTWMWSIEKANTDLGITIRGVPFLMVRHLRGIVGFLPKRAILSTIYFDYVCTDCDHVESRMVAPVIGADGAPPTLEIPDTIPCPKCRAKMELDMNMKGKEFADFLKKNPK